jgi:ABC-type transport system involved in multi-copper enzyme maturation permease subunit
MSLFAKEVLELKTRFLLLFVLIAVTGYFILLYYDFFISWLDIDMITEGLETSPLSQYMDTAALIQQLSMILNDMDFYLWSQWLGKNLYQIIILSSILLGFSSFARETEQQTISFLLSNFTRRQIFTSKTLAGSILLLLLVSEGCFLPLVLGSDSVYYYTWSMAGSYLLQMGAAAIFLYAAMVLFSVLSGDVIKPIIASIIMLVFLSLPGLSSHLADLYLFRYMTGFDIFIGNGLHYVSVLVLILASYALLTLSWRIYRQKDF